MAPAFKKIIAADPLDFLVRMVRGMPGAENLTHDDVGALVRGADIASVSGPVGTKGVSFSFSVPNSLLLLRSPHLQLVLKYPPTSEPRSRAIKYFLISAVALGMTIGLLPILPTWLLWIGILVQVANHINFLITTPKIWRAEATFRQGYLRTLSDIVHYAVTSDSLSVSLPDGAGQHLARQSQAELLQAFATIVKRGDVQEAVRAGYLDQQLLTGLIVQTSKLLVLSGSAENIFVRCCAEDFLRSA